MKVVLELSTATALPCNTKAKTDQLPQKHENAPGMQERLREREKGLWRGEMR
jgi:hypothetical protein